jgi:Ca-activated chloride channel family protein
MKQLIIVILFLLPATGLFAQQEKSLVKDGNKLYEQKKYTEAEQNYRKSIQKKKNTEGDFNLGDALYKQKKFDEASQQFTQLAGTPGNKALAAKAYHNLGNSLLENKKLEESVDAYKKALINNPKDDETRYNLAYAQEKLKQQQKDKDNKDNKDKKNDKNKKDNKNQDKKDDKKDDKNKDNKNQDKNQDKKDDKKDENKNGQDKKDQKDQQQQPNKLSKEDAERMLDALNNDEKQTQDKLKNKKLKGVKVKIEKDW